MSEMLPKIETAIAIRYAETDQMGIAHHSNYPVWFEIGRTDFFRQIGFPYSEIESNGILLPLTDMNCKFIKPARFEDSLVIQTYINRLMHVRVGFHYDVYHKESGTMIATGETNHGWTDRQLHPISIEKHFPALHEALRHSVKNEC